MTTQLTTSRREAETARVAFARSAAVIGECLYSPSCCPTTPSSRARSAGPRALIGVADEPDDPGIAIAPCVHPDDRACFDSEWRYALLVESDGQIIEQRYRLIGHDGVTRWVLDRARITVIGGRVFLSGATCDVSAQHLAEEQRVEDLGRLEWLSRVDSLTGIFNRRHLSDLLDSRAVNDDASSAIALIDVDFFKRINDAYGHTTGDGVLRAVARRLRAAPGARTSLRAGAERSSASCSARYRTTPISRNGPSGFARQSAEPDRAAGHPAGHGYGVDWRRAFGHVPTDRRPLRERRLRALRGQARGSQPHAHRSRRPPLDAAGGRAALGSTACR